MWLNCEKHLPGYSNGNMKLQFDKKSSIVCGSPTAHKYLLEQIKKYAK